jgi:pyruvate formate lyase activating enzyme
MIGRREFLAEMARLGVGAGMAPLVARLLAGAAHADGQAAPQPARYWELAPDGGAQCTLCPREDSLHRGEFGHCKVRQNVGGRLVTHGWGQPCVLNIDPIEKNPLAHVLPGALMLSVAHAGCNLRCLYCQNWQFSQSPPTQTRNIRDFDAAASVRKGVEKKLRGLAFTYTEPAMCPEFLAEMARLARPHGLLLTMCTCGYVQPRPLREMLEFFSAVTITYKGATEAFYKKVCGGSLKPVLDSMLLAKAERKWLEVATLIVPTLNDGEADLKGMAAWLARNLGPDTPWHLERFMPEYQLAKLPPTPQATLEKARQIGLDAGLRFVYISNLAPHEGNHSYCPGCRKAVIRRLGFKVLGNDLRDGRCPHCGMAWPGLWS